MYKWRRHDKKMRTMQLLGIRAKQNFHKNLSSRETIFAVLIVQNYVPKYQCKHEVTNPGLCRRVKPSWVVEKKQPEFSPLHEVKEIILLGKIKMIHKFYMLNVFEEKACTKQKQKKLFC